MPRVVFVVSSAITALCVIVLAVVVVFDARAARYTAGKFPAEFSQRLTPAARGDYRDVVGVAHNAGDDVGQATKAVAYGADAVEIDVRAVGHELVASHDAPVPLLEDLVFRGPPLDDAWQVAALRPTVLLHLKQVVQRTIPSAQRLLLILNGKELRRMQTDPGLQRVIDGASVRDALLTPDVQARLERRRLATFAWVVNDEARLEDLVAEGVDGIITERLDIMHLLGTGTEVSG